MINIDQCLLVILLVSLIIDGLTTGVILTQMQIYEWSDR